MECSNGSLLISGAICGIIIINLDYDWDSVICTETVKYVLNYLVLLKEGTLWQLNFIEEGGRFIWVIMRWLLGNMWNIEMIIISVLFVFCNKNTSCLLMDYKGNFLLFSVLLYSRGATTNSLLKSHESSWNRPCWIQGHWF